MISKLMNWAIFGIAAVGWQYASTWSTTNSDNSVAGMLAVSLITLSLVNGKTSGGNGIEHIIAGVKGCLNLLIGWLVAIIVYDVLSSLIATGSLDINALIYAVLGAMIVVFAAVVTFSALNAVRE